VHAVVLGAYFPLGNPASSRSDGAGVSN
jgi:hypothetical protein